MKTQLLFSEESYKIIGVCFEVYREKECGFLEPVYQECMEIELRLQGVPYNAEAAESTFCRVHFRVFRVFRGFTH